MRNIITLLLSVFAIVLTSQAQNRIKENFDFDWQFHLGDVPHTTDIDFTPKDWEWENVQLPHDWSIKLPFDEKIDGSAGFLPGGIGLYKKVFTVPAEYKGKNVSVIFDGIYHQASIYLNGKQIDYHRYGYTSFSCNLTPYLNYGAENQLFVQVDRNEVSRWYTGSGIYRHAWLEITEPLHVALWGTYVTTPAVSEKSADINITTSIANNGTDEKVVSVIQTLLDKDCCPIISGDDMIQEESRITVASNDTVNISQSLKIANPHLWSIESPYRYFVQTVLKTDDKITDTYITPFGIRYYNFDKDSGFSLNGKHIKLKGVNLHQDAGVLGVAVPDRSVERRLQILKNFGCNAIRCSHNPPSPQFLEMCDTLGFFVIDEAFDKWKSGYYGEFFDVSWRKDLSDMIYRDRNHPCIFLWSIGNEVAEAKDSIIGPQRASMLRDLVHEIEPTRPVTMALQPGARDEIAEVVDVIGYNYMEPRIAQDRMKYPERVFYVSEAYPYYSTARVNESRDYLPVNPWNFVADNDFMLGSFIWAGVDYIGESTGWPSKGWTCSPFDICMFEKPAAAYHRSVWKDEPMVKLAVVDPSLDIAAGKDHWQYPLMADHWNFPYTDSRVLEVRSMTNCDEVQLIVNGKDFGRRKVSKYPNNTVIWYQPYRKGKVLAIGYIDNKEVCRDSLVTSKNTDHLELFPDVTTLKADGQDLSHITVRLYDENGVPVQTDNRKLKVTVEGEGKFLGIDNGDLRREGSFVGNELDTYFGKALIVVQSTRNAGKILVKVEMQGSEKVYETELISQ